MNDAELFLSAYETRISTLAEQVREYLFRRLPGIVEEVDAAARIISYAYGKGYKHTLCVILLSKKGVKLGFYKGSELPDPEKLLKGTGKVHRFVEIASGEILKSDALDSLLAAAVKAYQERTTQPRQDGIR